MLLARGAGGLQQAILFRVWLRQAVRQGRLCCPSTYANRLQFLPSCFMMMMMMAPVQCSLCSQCSRGWLHCLPRAHSSPDPYPTNLEMNILHRLMYLYIYSVYLLYMCPICALSCFFFVARNTFMSLPLSLSSLCNPLKLSRIGTATTTTPSSLLAQCSS